MGNDNSKGKKAFKPKNIDKSKLDILIKQVFFTAQLNKDRRNGQKNSKEKELLALVREPANKRNKDNEYSKASAIVNDIKSVKAHECIMRYADILKDNEMVIQLSKGDTSRINDLIPYVESVIWGCQKCNLDCVKQFEAFIIEVFGQETHLQLLQFTKVTPELKNYFNSILPSQKEVKLYLIEFCNKNGISLDLMNEIGHGLSPTELADLPDPNNQHINQDTSKNPSNNSQGSQQGGQGPFHPGGFPQGGNYQTGGYPPYGGFQPGFQGGSQPGFYPPYGGYQPGYPGGNQGGYPQYGGYPQNQGYPQGGPQQGGFPSYGGYPQQQGGYPQGNQGFNYQQGQSIPDFQTPTYQPQNAKVTLGSHHSYNPSQPNIQPGQGPENNNNNNKQQSNAGPNDFGGYPAFTKFTEPTSNGKSGYDPLDELDMRLKNIKEGL